MRTTSASIRSLRMYIGAVISIIRYCYIVDDDYHCILYAVLTNAKITKELFRSI